MTGWIAVVVALISGGLGGGVVATYMTWLTERWHRRADRRRELLKAARAGAVDLVKLSRPPVRNATTSRPSAPRDPDEVVRIASQITSRVWYIDLQHRLRPEVRQLLADGPYNRNGTTEDYLRECADTVRTECARIERKWKLA